MISVETIRVRWAHSADWDVVRQIRSGEEIAGSDHLRNSFPFLIQNKNIYCIVLEHNGRVIGFRAYALLSDGEGVIGLDARVHPEYQGQGMMKKLETIGTEMIKALRPKVTYLWWVVTNNTRYQSVVDNPSLRPTWTLVEKWKDIWYYTTKVKMEQVMSEHCDLGEDTSIFDLDLASDILKKKSEIASLFPRGVFVTGSSWFAQKSSYPNLMQAVRRHHTLVTLTDDNKMKALSFGSAELCDMTVTFDVTFYSIDTCTDVLISHALQQVQHLVTLISPTKASDQLEIAFAYPTLTREIDAKHKLNAMFGDNGEGGKNNSVDSEELLWQCPFQCPFYSKL